MFRGLIFNLSDAAAVVGNRNRVSGLDGQCCADCRVAINFQPGLSDCEGDPDQAVADRGDSDAGYRVRFDFDWLDVSGASVDVDDLLAGCDIGRQKVLLGNDQLGSPFAVGVALRNRAGGFDDPRGGCFRALAAASLKAPGETILASSFRSPDG